MSLKGKSSGQRERMPIQDSIKDVSVVASCRSREEQHFAQQLMIACGIANYTVRPDFRAALKGIAETKPDVAVIIYDRQEEYLQGFFSALRSPLFEGNRYLPVIAAVWHPSIAEIKLAIELGASEIVSMPASTEAMSRAIYRAVFVGRPFIDTKNYFGPCRRRKQIANFGKEKRKLVWDYSHASVKQAASAE